MNIVRARVVIGLNALYRHPVLIGWETPTHGSIEQPEAIYGEGYTGKIRLPVLYVR
ncbi:MAG: hypothetical protein OXH03_10715 [Bacteroidetes bacterium]|nr:hypothetical protein [Bacteroidota bacterium]MDE2671214.1 hypothetical protein [Bacteroidota bacterium]